MSVAIITGASRGLGLALARGLNDAGWKLVLTARGAQALHDAAGPLGVTIPGDVADPAHRERLIGAARDLGGLDLLVNNAGTLGVSPLPSMAEYPVGALREVYEINVLAPIALAQLALPLLRQSEGALLSLSSDAAVEAYEGWGGYGSAKAALDQAMRVMGAEEPGVRIWAADPGDMRTQMYQEAFPGEDISDRPLPETVVPAILALLTGRPSSGRIRLA
ncbi:SDR family NAD(P)-dependent oxidoreductase [Longispora albida]|uniref:SDR family NAD(P)-dependent oxidoreductase n=1 Tax=Longispora albida TaxID=203523 RepID=UPI00036B2FF0|nr:SDR family NAD(P)-dependent oxidoreductase [Longispora albida]